MPKFRHYSNPPAHANLSSNRGVIQFPGHKYHACDEVGCLICEGALSYCVTCRGGEGDLPTHCPGQVMTFSQMDAVMCGDADYHYQQGWVQRSTQWRRTK